MAGFDDPQDSFQATSEKILEFNFQPPFILSLYNPEGRNIFTLQQRLLCYFHHEEVKKVIEKPQEKINL